MDSIFRVLATEGGLKFYNHFDVSRFCHQYDGIEMIVTIKQAAKTGQKMKMYSFYHGPVLDCAVRGYTNAGYSGVDKVLADYLLRSEFAKDFYLKPNGETVVIMLDKSKMSKERLNKLLQDCIFFIETELQQEIPDSAEYKAKKETGKNFRKAGK